MKAKPLILLAANAVLAAFLAAPSHAQPSRYVQCRVTYPGLVLQKYHYQAPDGTYYSYSGYVRSVNGTPCGIECDAPSEHAILIATPPGYECYETVTGTRNGRDR
ncbi:MAG: hypothetical protein ACLPTZ_26550 [Beijerinckiaceae bacterium]